MTSCWVRATGSADASPGAPRFDPATDQRDLVFGEWLRVFGRHDAVPDVFVEQAGIRVIRCDGGTRFTAGAETGEAGEVQSGLSLFVAVAIQAVLLKQRPDVGFKTAGLPRPLPQRHCVRRTRRARPQERSTHRIGSVKNFATSLPHLREELSLEHIGNN